MYAVNNLEMDRVDIVSDIASIRADIIKRRAMLIGAREGSVMFDKIANVIDAQYYRLLDLEARLKKLNSDIAYFNSLP